MKVVANGIDVSYAQGKIDWEKVKKSGKVQFAMIRGGYGKGKKNSKGEYTDSQVDDQFENNYAGCKQQGIPVGVYHYSYADTVSGAEQEAEFCLSYLKGKSFDYPIAYDLEEQGSVSKSTLTEMAKAFCNKIKSAGYIPMIYTSKSYLTDKMNPSELSEFDIWVAQIYKEVTYTGTYTMWQYSWTGNIDGISGEVDLDYSYKDYTQSVSNYPYIVSEDGTFIDSNYPDLSSPTFINCTHSVIKTDKSGNKQTIMGTNQYTGRYPSSPE